MPKLFLSCSLLLLCSQALAAEVTYRRSGTTFANPERGLYQQFTARSERRLLSFERLLKLRESGMTLLLRMYYLEKFRDRDISAAQLKLIQEDFAVIRQAGCKCILRFAYAHNMGVPDAPLNVVLRHIEQLQPILQENADVIAVVQAGFIGPWGEWHNSSHGLESKRAMRTIALRLLEALPPFRCIQVRTPRYKWAILGSSEPLDQTQAFSDEPEARIGHHNDCFLADSTDAGTYRIERMAEEKRYLAQDTQYLPMGGETCAVSEFTAVDNARAEMRRFHWSYLNSEFHPRVLAEWKEQGFLTEVSQRLGYRLCLHSSSCPSQACPKGSWSLTLRMENLGWAAPFNRRSFLVVLKQPGAAAGYAAPVPFDLRCLLPGQTTNVRFEAGIPADMPAGRYEVHLWLPDPAERLLPRQEYAIRLANENMWTEDTGTNDLQQTLVVLGRQTDQLYDGETLFRPVVLPSASRIGVKTQ